MVECSTAMRAMRDQLLAGAIFFRLDLDFTAFQ